jgi:hypothetical protein
MIKISLKQFCGADSQTRGDAVHDALGGLMRAEWTVADRMVLP